MTLKQHATEFKRALTGYQTTGSADARKRLTRAVLKYLRAGGRMSFTAPAQQTDREDAVIQRALSRGRKSA